MKKPFLFALFLLSCPAWGQQVASDTFVRADGGLGANWTTIDNAPSISGNLFTAGAGGVQYNAIWSANAFNNNQYSKITLDVFNGANESAVIRETAGGTSTGYYALAVPGVGLTIYKQTGNAAFTSIASNGTLFVPGDVLLFSAVGTTLTACRNGTSVLSTTDATYASGAAGASAGTTAQISAWSGGNMSAAGCLIPGQPVISPASPVVNQGGTIQFTCTNCAGIVWSCAGTDSTGAAAACAGSINASTGLYTAPATVTSQQSYGGYQLLPNNHAYNVRIDSLGVDASSAAWIAASGTSALNYLSILRPNYVDNTTPTLNMIFQYTTSSNGLFQIPQDTVYTSPFMECGWLKQEIVSGNGACDRHWWTIDRTNGNFQEGYFLFNTGGVGPSSETLTNCPSAGLTTCTAVSGVRYASSSYRLPADGATDAAGLFVMPLTLHAQEFEQALAASGAINHALRFTLQNNYICGSSTANACGENAVGTRHIWPATSEAFAGFGTIPYGARARLKAAFDISTFSAGAKILLTQLKQYGIILADGGSGWQVSTEASNNNATFASVLNELAIAHITPSNFEFVNELGLKIASSSGETIGNREIITATVTGGSGTIDVVLTGVTVGLPNDNINIQAGMGGQQLTAYVHGGALNTVTWAMSPSVGTLTSGGLYTPPATVASPTTTTVTATSVDNAAVAAQMTVIVLPVGTIRLTTTLTGQYTDTNGDTWWPKLDTMVTEGSLAVSNGGSFPATPDITLYKKPAYPANDVAADMTLTFIVPNGIYQVTGKFLDNRGSSCIAGTAVASIEVQAVVRKASQDVCTESGGHNQPLDSVASNVAVTNNHLTYVLRNMGSLPTTVAQGEPFISALSIAQTASLGAATTLTPGVKVTSGVTIR